MWYVRHKESNEPWVGSRGKVKEVDVRQKLVYLIEVYEGWGEGGGGGGVPRRLNNIWGQYHSRSEEPDTISCIAFIMMF